jgi:hypothetical protein
MTNEVPEIGDEWAVKNVFRNGEWIARRHLMPNDPQSFRSLGVVTRFLPLKTFTICPSDQTMIDALGADWDKKQ